MKKYRIIASFCTYSLYVLIESYVTLAKTNWYVIK